MVNWGNLARESLRAGHNAVVSVADYSAQAVYTAPAEFDGLAQSVEHRIEFFNDDLPGIAEGVAVAFSDGRAFKVRQLLETDEAGLRTAILSRVGV